MKKTILGTLLIGLGILYIKPVNAFFFGVGTWSEPSAHVTDWKKSKCMAGELDWYATTWLDPGMIAATALDWGVQKKHGKITVNAKDALAKLEDALKGGCSDRKSVV